jgi:hypothetical protein
VLVGCACTQQQKYTQVALSFRVAAGPADVALFCLVLLLLAATLEESGISSGADATENVFYVSLFATMLALHEQEFASISAHVRRTLTAFAKLRDFSSALQTKICTLKNVAAAQSKKISAYHDMFAALLAKDHEATFMNLKSVSSKQYRPNSAVAGGKLGSEDVVKDIAISSNDVAAGRNIQVSHISSITTLHRHSCFAIVVQ